jgi:hypothetical protein
MTRLEMFLAVIIGSCAFLLAAASVSSWTTTVTASGTAVARWAW